jgi:hypothetical protein
MGIWLLVAILRKGRLQVFHAAVGKCKYVTDARIGFRCQCSDDREQMPDDRSS